MTALRNMLLDIIIKVDEVEYFRSCGWDEETVKIICEKKEVQQ